MGDNAMRFYQGTPARLPGFHRAFNHASTRRWGSEAHPCPILGLSPDGECQGVAFEIPRSDVRDVLRKIERREAQEEFQRKRVRVQLPHGSDTKALVWVTRNGLLQSPRWPRDPNQLDSDFRTAHGIVGTGVEYIRTMIHAMERWQISDPMVEAVWKTLKPYSNPKG
jgi:cation transport protein ChaC